jgi:hypothetical protein
VPDTSPAHHHRRQTSAGNPSTAILFSLSQLDPHSFLENDKQPYAKDHPNETDDNDCKPCHHCTISHLSSALLDEGMAGLHDLDDDSDDEDESPVSRRPRRLTEKQLQLSKSLFFAHSLSDTWLSVQDLEAAKARKTAKSQRAEKAARKQELLDAGQEPEEEELEPRADNTVSFPPAIF